MSYLFSFSQDAAQSAGFHPSGAVVAVGTQMGRYKHHHQKAFSASALG